MAGDAEVSPVNEEAKIKRVLLPTYVCVYAYMYTLLEKKGYRYKYINTVYKAHSSSITAL